MTDVQTDAKTDWERRIYRRVTETAGADPASELPTTTGLAAEPGNGFVRLSWDAVPGAAGYVIERGAPGADQEDREIISHGGSDVPAVVGTAFADTGVEDGETYSYRVGAVLGNEHPVWHWSEAVEGTTTGTSGGRIEVRVDAAGDAGQLDRLWWLIGSERLTQLKFGDLGNGHHIGDEFAEALEIAHRDLGVSAVRAHAILHDDNHVVTRDGDTLVFDFTVVDELYDKILSIGIRPVVELGFMPACIARDADETVFEYRGIISPPADWAEWKQTVKELAAHLVERYGIDEVATWGFEVWNEPNLEVFWSGTQEEYLRLYEEAARAIKEVDQRLTVGGPSTAASEWVEALAAYAEKHALPLELATTHTYGNYPLDFRSVLERHGFGDADILWTEWGVGSTHFGPIHDGVAGAPFMLSGFQSAQHRLKALSYWVVSDHFEELGRPTKLFHDGFGLLTLGNLRKPRYWALHLAAHQGDQVLPADLTGDGADVLVRAWASRHDDGTVDVLLWNNTINSQVMHGDDRLVRDITVTVDGLSAATYGVQVARIDEQHSNIKAASSGADWPDEDEWAGLQEADQLHTEQGDDLSPTSGSGSVSVRLPQPGVARIRLTPDGHRSADDEEITR